MAVSEANVSGSKQWIKEFYDACKSLDVECVLTFFTKEIEIGSASGASIEGYYKIRSHLKSLFPDIVTQGYNLGNICVMPLKTRQEATIHLILNNDPEQERISVQSKAIFHKKKGVNSILKIEISGDFSKLKEKLERLNSAAQSS